MKELKKKEKADLYNKYNLNLVGVFPKDLDDLDKNLLPKLEKYGVIRKSS